MGYNEVVKSLARGVISSVYLLHGEERYLINSLTNEFKKYILQGGTADFNFDLLNDDSTPSEIVERANTLPVMADKRLIIVKNKNLFNSSKKSYSEKEIEQLINYMKNPSASTCLVFSITEKVDGRTKLFKTIKKYGQVLKFEHLKDWEVTKWVERHVASHGKNINRDSLDYLCSSIGNNLEMLDMELQKLYSYVGKRKTIELKDVQEVSSRTIINNIFDLVDALAEGKSEKAIFLLRDILLAGEPEARVLFMIIRQFRLMLQAKLLYEKGYTLNNIVQKTNWHPYVAKKVLQQSKFYSVIELENYLNFLLQIDVQFKTTKISLNYLLETVILRLAKIS